MREKPMVAAVLKAMLVSVAVVILIGCPTMDGLYNRLRLANNSDTKVKVLLNLEFPDSSLARARPYRYINPRSIEYIGTLDDLRLEPGVTLFVFDHAYYHEQWNEQVGRPDTYLDQARILKKFVLSKPQLDSAGWILSYP